MRWREKEQTRVLSCARHSTHHSHIHAGTKATTPRGWSLVTVQLGSVQAVTCVSFLHLQHRGTGGDICCHRALSARTGSAAVFGAYNQAKSDNTTSWDRCDTSVRPCFQELVISTTVHKEGHLEKLNTFISFLFWPFYPHSLVQGQLLKFLPLKYPKNQILCKSAPEHKINKAPNATLKKDHVISSSVSLCTPYYRYTF